MHQDIFNSTGEDIAQVIQGCCGNVSIVFERVQGTAAKVVSFYERVCCYAFTPHRFPKRVIGNNGTHPDFTPNDSIILMKFHLEYSRYTGYNGYCRNERLNKLKAPPLDGAFHTRFPSI